MSEANFAPPNTTRTDPKIGHVVEDQRSGDRRLIIYVDSRVVLTRDEAGNTTLTPRNTFETSLGSRYRLRNDATPDVDAGQYGPLRERLAAYEAEDGRKAAHKAAALHEALDVVADGTRQPMAEGNDDGAPADADTDASGDAESPGDAAEDPEVAFEEIPGIGPETAGKLRTQGFVTESDVRRASDEAILAVSGLGPSNLANLREHLE